MPFGSVRESLSCSITVGQSRKWGSAGARSTEDQWMNPHAKVVHEPALEERVGHGSIPASTEHQIECAAEIASGALRKASTRRRPRSGLSDSRAVTHEE
jgi:hypothetical protein